MDFYPVVSFKLLRFIFFYKSFISPFNLFRNIWPVKKKKFISIPLGTFHKSVPSLYCFHHKTLFDFLLFILPQVTDGTSKTPSSLCHRWRTGITLRHPRVDNPSLMIPTHLPDRGLLREEGVEWQRWVTRSSKVHSLQREIRLVIGSTFFSPKNLPSSWTDPYKRRHTVSPPLQTLPEFPNQCKEIWGKIWDSFPS